MSTLKLTGVSGAAMVEAVRGKADLAEARLRLEQAQVNRHVLKAAKQLALGDYDAARRTRTRTGGLAQDLSADGQLDEMTLVRLRAESQRLVRNSPVMRGGVSRLKTAIVGPRGMSLQVRTGDKAWNRACERAFRRWAERCCDARGLAGFDTIQRGCIHGRVVDGDIALVATAGRGVIPEDVLRLQAIEAQRIRSRQFGRQATSGTGKPEEVCGVQLDRDGAPLKFLVANYSSYGSVQGQTPVEVDAGDVFFFANRVRLGQTRGEPKLAALVRLVDQLDKFVEAAVVSARVGACQSLLIKTPLPAAAQAAAAGQTLNRLDGGSDKLEEIVPGTIRRLGPGEEAMSFNPLQPSVQFTDFVRMVLRLCGGDVDLPLELMLLDFSQSTAYAGRTGVMEAYRALEAWQVEFVRSVLGPVYRRLVPLWMLAGVLPWNDQWEEHVWLAPARPVFEPDKEVNAAVAEINARLLSRREYCERRGRDFDEVASQLAEEEKLLTSLGVAPVQMPGAGVGASGKPVEEPAAV